ncbi:hypothetical protein DM860_013247 [Cuscuta australis]|uniref:GPI inositol-deacylase n=2 Tax=Cuscuta sect. Cleistogrammica TaxID=1824901 RepID=A0A328DNN0_9ASTE|nr:hypothetical protein DM860_013247 [Cuscuta australis]
MLRLHSGNTRQYLLRFNLRRFVSSSMRRVSTNSVEGTPIKLENSLPAPHLPAPQYPPATVLFHSKRSRSVFIALSATIASAVVAPFALILMRDDEDGDYKQTAGRVYREFENVVEKTKVSFTKTMNRMKQTGMAASVLWKSLRSLMSSANHEVRVGFEIRVAALLADIAAASESRRAALVGAGSGAVVDWLLETVSSNGENLGTQAESARALAYLIADPNVCEAVFGRPHAVPNLLRFIFSAQPRRSNRKGRSSSFGLSDSLKGRSMLVAAIMDVVTSHCQSADKVSFKPILPQDAEMRDIAAAIEVIAEGGMHWDDPHQDGEDDDGGKGVKGIGIKILEGTTVLGLARTKGFVDMGHSDDSQAARHTHNNLLFSKISEKSAKSNLSSAVVPGLWDDLHSEQVAVPFAAWALANWAMSSEANRTHIQELDQDGQAIMAALMAPERSVKWHGSLIARLLLEDEEIPLNENVSDWSSCLLSIVSQASKAQDFPLTHIALSAFLVALKRSAKVQEVAVEKGLHLMRVTAKQTTKHASLQEALAKALELLYTREMHMSVEESQKWSGILLPWIFAKSSSDEMRSSAINILSCILEDYGPSSLAISQGWLTLLLSDILNYRKAALVKGNAELRTDKVKTQIDQANIVSATQTANQLAMAVVNLAGMQLGADTETDDTFPLADLLSLEPFVGPFKNLKKDKVPKIDAADSALATLKGIKALNEISAEDSVCLHKIADFGVLCLIRRLLLEDDYEQLSAIEAYDASRAPESPENLSSVSGEASANSNPGDTSSVRVPPTAHIRRHAARLLTVLSVLPKVKKSIIADKAWRRWLGECAEGKVPGCNDLKIRSYARATLLNVFSAEQTNEESVDCDASLGSTNKTHPCPQYADMVFVINPEKPHWKCMASAIPTSTVRSSTSSDDSLNTEKGASSTDSNGNNSSTAVSEPMSSQSESPLFDVVFVHGLRGGPFKTWRLSEDKYSTKSGLVEKIDEEAGMQGTFWPGEWLPTDFPAARLYTLKYKTNLTQWSGASLPLQEVSSMLLEKLVAAGIGKRPVVFVTHSMGGLVVKQMLYQAKAENKEDLVNNTAGVVFYSCPHFGSKLADMPWRMGLVFRPAPSIGELRSGSPRLVELNDFLRRLHKRGTLEVLSFCETKVTPIVEGYGGWAFRMEIVPLESAYPGFGELVVLESTDHINSCKPLNRNDPSYKETLQFLHKLKAHHDSRIAAVD